MKHQKSFTFPYPLKTQRTGANLKRYTAIVGVLEIHVVGYFNPNESLLSDERYTADIDRVIFEGTDIRKVLEVFEQLDEITEEAIRRVSEQFNQMEAA